MPNKLILPLLLTLTLLLTSGGGAEVKGMFVFGSSLVDNGNNNYLTFATVKADYSPYGIDCPLGASGRFSNGRNAIDVLGQLLSLPSLIPPFNDPETKGEKIVHGVNYASGGSGILSETGSISGEVINLNQQIKNFQTKTVPDLEAQLGGRQKLCGHLKKCLFVVGTGGNDYLLNYFMPSLVMKKNLTEFTTELITTLSSQLEKLYGMGARKFVLFSIQAIGCVPVVRATLRAKEGSCVESINQAALLFNAHLKSLVDKTESRMPGSTMVYVDSYNILKSIIDNPALEGFTDTSNACCDLSITGVLCERKGRACEDRATHVFFDGLHPTDAVNVRISSKAYNSNLETEVHPINVKQLAQL